MRSDEGARSFAWAGWGPADLVRGGLTALALILGGVALSLGVTHGLRLAGITLPAGAAVALVFALEALLIPPAWAWGPRKHGGGWASLGLRSFSLPLGAVLVIGSFFLVLAINVAWEGVRQRLGLPGQPPVLPLFGDDLGGLALALLLGAVVAPLAEEVFFRGFVYPGLRRQWGVVWGIVISSALFAVVHAIPGVVPAIFAMGLILAALYELTGSLWPSIALHAIINAAGLVGAYLLERFPELANGPV